MFNRGSLPALEAIMHFTTARHKALANNVANVDTVGYKAKDVPVAAFRKALARAFEAQKESRVGIFALEPARGITPSKYGLDVEFVEAEDAGILKHTGNNVDLDIEMGKMVKNAGRHNTAAALVKHQLDMLHMAIRGRAGA